MSRTAAPSASWPRCRRSPAATAPPRRRRAPSRPIRVSDAVFEALRFRQRFELLERVVLDLADPLAGDAERATDLLERARLRAREPEPELDHLPFAVGERVERPVDV